jgi:DNA-binding IclR family transcriptional regulator
MDSVSGVGVLDKSVAILDALAREGPLALADLVTATDLPRPTTHRLAVALEAHGLVGRDRGGRFRLGPRLATWGRLASPAHSLAEAAAPVLAALRDTTGESAQLFVRDGDGRLCVAAAERPAGLRDTVPVGAVLPLDRGSGGKVLLAWSPGGTRRPELAAVRKRGWAESVAEREAGVASVSAPVFDANGVLLAAIAVSGPIDRLGRAPGRRFANDVVNAAHALEAALDT